MEQRFRDPFFGDGDVIPSPERLRKVLVVGAGVAGLQTARQLLKLGCQVLVLEANDEVGGVWIRNYIGYGLQVPWKLYQFPEFPWPKDLQPSSEYPTGQEVQEYVQAYCRAYNLRPHIRFNCKLLRLRWCPSTRQWDALYCDTAKEKFFKVTVDYAVVCAGIYSQPYIPDYEGTDTYAGIQLHAKDFVDLSLARGRRVVIVGAGKTALDCVSSIVATNTATSVTLLYRQAHWPLPRRMLGTSVRRLLFNRAVTRLMPPYYTASRGAHVADRAAAPIKKLFWRSLENVITRKFHITEQMRPRVHLPTDLFYGGQILDNTMDKLIRSEALQTVKGEINRFVRNGVILQDGNFVAADLVLYCTGYLKTYEYLEGDMRSRLDLQKDGLYLYRNCLPCAVPHLAFIGSEVSTYNNILTHGLQALWLAHVLSGHIQLPPVAAMVEDVRAQQRWRRSIMPAQRSRGSVLMVYMMQYHDQLLADMGQSRKRKGLNFLAECFGAYTAADYRPLLEQDHAEIESARQRAAEQLAAAGVPPAVLAATAAGHGGHVPLTSVQSPAPAPPPPPAAATSAAIAVSGANARSSAHGMNNGCYTSGIVGGASGAAAAVGGMNSSGPFAMAPARYGCFNGVPLDDRLYGSSRADTSASTRSGCHDSDSAYSNPGGAAAVSTYGSPATAGGGGGGGVVGGARRPGVAHRTAAMTAAVMSPGTSSAGRISDPEADDSLDRERTPILSSPSLRPAATGDSSVVAATAAAKAAGAAATVAAPGGCRSSDALRGISPTDAAALAHSEHLRRARLSADYAYTAMRFSPGNDIAGSRRCHPLSSADLSHALAANKTAAAAAAVSFQALSGAYPGGNGSAASAPVHGAMCPGPAEAQRIPSPRLAASARAATAHGYCATVSGLGWTHGCGHGSYGGGTTQSPLYAAAGGSPGAQAGPGGCRSFTGRAAASAGSGGAREGHPGSGLVVVPSSPSRLSRHTGPSSPPPEASPLLPHQQQQQMAAAAAPGALAPLREGTPTEAFQQAQHAQQHVHSGHGGRHPNPVSGVPHRPAGHPAPSSDAASRSVPDNTMDELCLDPLAGAGTGYDIVSDGGVYRACVGPELLAAAAKVFPTQWQLTSELEVPIRACVGPAPTAAPAAEPCSPGRQLTGNAEGPTRHVRLASAGREEDAVIGMRLRREGPCSCASGALVSGGRTGPDGAVDSTRADSTARDLFAGSSGYGTGTLELLPAGWGYEDAEAARWAGTEDGAACRAAAASGVPSDDLRPNRQPENEIAPGLGPSEGSCALFRPPTDAGGRSAGGEGGARSASSGGGSPGHVRRPRGSSNTIEGGIDIAAQSNSRLTACGGLAGASGNDRSHRLSSRSRSRSSVDSRTSCTTSSSGGTACDCGASGGDAAEAATGATSAEPDAVPPSSTATAVAGPPLAARTVASDVASDAPPSPYPGDIQGGGHQNKEQQKQQPEPGALTGSAAGRRSGSPAIDAVWQASAADARLYGVHVQRHQYSGQWFPVPAAAATAAVVSTGGLGGPGPRRASLMAAARPSLCRLPEEDGDADYLADRVVCEASAKPVLGAASEQDSLTAVAPTAASVLLAASAAAAPGPGTGAGGPGAAGARIGVGAVVGGGGAGWVLAGPSSRAGIAAASVVSVARSRSATAGVGGPGAGLLLLPPHDGSFAGLAGVPAAPDSGNWQRLLSAVFSNGGSAISTGSSGMLLNSNISLAAGLGPGAGSGDPVRLSTLSRSHTFGESNSCSLGNWVGQTAVALGGGSPATSGVAGGDSASRDGARMQREDVGISSPAASRMGPGHDGNTGRVGRGIRGAETPAACTPELATTAAALMTLAETSPFTSPRD